MFYALLVFAALTSTISMHEIGTAFFHEELRQPRRRAAWVLTVACSVIAVGCSLSMGACPGLKLLGLNLLDFCDKLTAQYLLPLGSLLTCLFVGWYVPRATVHGEFTNNGALRGRFFGLYLFAVRFLCPLCIALIFLHQMGVI